MEKDQYVEIKADGLPGTFGRISKITKKYITVVDIDGKITRFDAESRRHKEYRFDAKSCKHKEYRTRVIPAYHGDYIEALVESKLPPIDTAPICQCCHKLTVEGHTNVTLSDNWMLIRNVVRADKLMLAGKSLIMGRRGLIDRVCRMNSNIGNNDLNDKDTEDKFKACSLTCNVFDEKNKSCLMGIYNHAIKVSKCGCKSDDRELDASCEICTAALQAEVRQLETLLDSMSKHPLLYNCMYCFTNFFQPICEMAYQNAYKSEAPIRMKKLKDHDREMSRRYPGPSHEEYMNAVRSNWEAKQASEVFRNEQADAWFEKHRTS